MQRHANVRHCRRTYFLARNHESLAVPPIDRSRGAKLWPNDDVSGGCLAAGRCLGHDLERLEEQVERMGEIGFLGRVPDVHCNDGVGAPSARATQRDVMINAALLARREPLACPSSSSP